MTRIIKHTINTPHFEHGLTDKLPEVRGRMTPNAPLRQFAWLNVGGPAEVLFRPEDRADLEQFIKNCPDDIPVTVLGVMSNCIIRDGGIPGVVIRLGRDFSAIDVQEDTHTITAGAGAIDMNVALAAAKHGIAGLEFLSGIPGTIGGALRMNAGAYNTETKDMLVSAEVMFPNGTIKTMTADNMGMTYRKNHLPDDVVFLSATFKGTAGDTPAIEEKIRDIKNRRAETQPIRTKTGGSTFANPSLDDPKITKKAWEFIDDAGCRGLKVGGATMSTMHCNFMLNENNATAADLERLGEEVRKRVFEKDGLMLRWEVKRLGVPAPEDKDILEFMARDAKPAG
ncbi:MAG: UDP-N-acetylmuramate dehydrogenase [Alphaproteobacteria bacterium]|nr:UDP-N-acetylmuramate dehydrogenase [Alphaproteobacteria bacterium]